MVTFSWPDFVARGGVLAGGREGPPAAGMERSPCVDANPGGMRGLAAGQGQNPCEAEVTARRSVLASYYFLRSSESAFSPLAPSRPGGHGGGEREVNRSSWALPPALLTPHPSRPPS